MFLRFLQRKEQLLHPINKRPPLSPAAWKKMKNNEK